MNLHIPHLSLSRPRLVATLALLLAATAAFNTWARRTEADVRAYIERYQVVALEHELTFHIPACITLAQGLLESDAGLSELAAKHNNHFGIKSFNWRGDQACYGDTSRRACYRVYGSSEDSFLDHARFLRGPRYSSLYSLDIADYRAWAEGLRQCGYAEDRAYPQKLISIIERYKLYELSTAAPATEGAPAMANVDDKARAKAVQQAKRAAEKAAKEAERERLKQEREQAKQRRLEQQAQEKRKHEAEKAEARAERERLLAQREQEREQEHLRQQQQRAQEKRERAERFAQRQAAAERQKAAAEAETVSTRRQLARPTQPTQRSAAPAASADND